MSKQTRTDRKRLSTGTSGEIQKTTEKKIQAESGKRLDIHQSSRPSPKRSPSVPPDWILKMLEAHKVNPDWITSGTGKMLLPEDEEVSLVPGNSRTP